MFPSSNSAMGMTLHWFQVSTRPTCPVPETWKSKWNSVGIIMPGWKLNSFLNIFSTPHPRRDLEGEQREKSRPFLHLGYSWLWFRSSRWIPDDPGWESLQELASSIPLDVGGKYLSRSPTVALAAAKNWTPIVLMDLYSRCSYLVKGWVRWQPRLSSAHFPTSQRAVGLSNGSKSSFVGC